MKVSLKSTTVLLLVMSIAAGVLLYPARCNCIQIILKDSDDKIITPDIEPNIRCGEPGDSPVGTIGTLGSSQGTGIDALKPALPQDDNREIRTARSRYMQLLFFYLRNFTHGPFRH